MRILEPLDSRMQHRQLALSPCADRIQRRLVIHKFAAPQNGNEQILVIRGRREMLAPCRVGWIHDRNQLRKWACFVVDGIADKLINLAKAPHLEHAVPRVMFFPHLKTGKKESSTPWLMIRYR